MGSWRNAVAAAAKTPHDGFSPAAAQFWSDLECRAPDIFLTIAVRAAAFRSAIEIASRITDEISGGILSVTAAAECMK